MPSHRLSGKTKNKGHAQTSNPLKHRYIAPLVVVVSAVLLAVLLRAQVVRPYGPDFLEYYALAQQLKGNPHHCEAAVDTVGPRLDSRFNITVDVCESNIRFFSSRTAYVRIVALSDNPDFMLFVNVGSFILAVALLAFVSPWAGAVGAVYFLWTRIALTVATDMYSVLVFLLIYVLYRKGSLSYLFFLAYYSFLREQALVLTLVFILDSLRRRQYKILAPLLVLAVLQFAGGGGSFKEKYAWSFMQNAGEGSTFTSFWLHQIPVATKEMVLRLGFYLPPIAVLMFLMRKKPHLFDILLTLLLLGFYWITQYVDTRYYIPYIAAIALITDAFSDPQKDT
ncbi:Uncharacterised protein [uncultured archaeon]|nr:Uncharacterised protein [uncultured archaeon]